MNEACGLLPPPFSSCIPRALASTLFPLPSPTTPFPAVSSLSRSPSLSPLTTLSPTTRLGVYATCACVRALSPIPLHRRGQQCSNVRVSIFLRFTGCTDYTRRAATGIYTGIIRETAATSRHTDRPDDESKAQADRPFPARLIRSKRFSNRRRVT